MLSRFTGRRRKDVDCGKTSGGNGPASKHKRTLEIEQLERLYVPAVLETHGYSARSDKEWQSLPVPQLHISVKKARAKACEANAVPGGVPSRNAG